MDKITRIHLAKIPYEIGVDAEKELKNYLEDIRSELDSELADDIMTDIEVRITEILTSRNVKRNDVITMHDIHAVQEQLGSPEQFTDGEAKGKADRQDTLGPKKLLRDPDGAYIGGVASGLGAYFGIDAIIIRLIFIALTFISGLGILLYVLLWILVPLAKTNSDRLRMRGLPVTAAALQRYRSSAQHTIATLRIRFVLEVLYRVFRAVFSLGLVSVVLFMLIAIGFLTSMLYTQPLHPIYSAYHLSYLLFGLIWLLDMTIIGLFIVLLIRLWRKGSNSLKIAFIALASVLVLTVAGAAVVTPFVVSHYKDQYTSNKLAVALPIHNDTTTIPTTLDVAADSNLTLSYIVSSQPMHATYQAYPGMGQPKLTIVNQNGKVTVQAGQLPQVVPQCVLNWCKQIYLPVRVTLYGPAMQNVVVDGGAEVDLNNIVDKSLNLTAHNNSNLSINNSYSDTLTLSADSGAMIDASDTSAQAATINVQNGASVFGPASSSLKANLPVGCDDSVLELSQPPATISLNGQTVTADVFGQDDCVNVDDPTPLTIVAPRSVPNVPAIPTPAIHIHRTY